MSTTDEFVIECRVRATARQARFWLSEYARSVNDALVAGVPHERIVDWASRSPEPEVTRRPPAEA